MKGLSMTIPLQGPRSASRGRPLRGVAAVELAITIIPLLIMALGVAEYGRAYFTYNALAKSVRNAARYMTAPSPADTDPIQVAKNLAVYGSATPSAAPIAPGLTTTAVQVTPQLGVPTGSGSINLVTVSIQGYRYQSVITYVAPEFIDFNTISVTMRTNL
jgi:Flp pilus assembly protein TadG